jgi:hypothetical protein
MTLRAARGGDAGTAGEGLGVGDGIDGHAEMADLALVLQSLQAGDEVARLHD